MQKIFRLDLITTLCCKTLIIRVPFISKLKGVNISVLCWRWKLWNR